MAAGGDTGQTFWCLPASGIRACMKACRAEGVQELFVTMWGDDGAYCEFDSALAGLTHAAELAYGGSVADDRLGELISGEEAAFP